jgi:hypothetical protein
VVKNSKEQDSPPETMADGKSKPTEPAEYP